MNRPVIACKVCGQAARYLCQTLNEHSRTRTLHHYRCGGCGLVFVGDALADQELGEAYATLNQATYYRAIKEENERKMRSCMADLARLAGRDRRILDVGTGDGQFLDMLLGAGFTRIAGHEIPGGDDLATLVARGCTIYRDFDYAGVPDGSADVVTLLDVAEHVQDPKLLFRACHRVLADGGLVYFHTPVVTSLDRVMHLVQKLPLLEKVGRVWQRGRTSVFHLQNYSRAALETLLSEAGFSDIEIAVRNELSWPVSEYVNTYLCELQRMPRALIPVVTPIVYPFLATDLFNANKAIGWARKRSAPARASARVPGPVPRSASLAGVDA